MNPRGFNFTTPNFRPNLEGLALGEEWQAALREALHNPEDLGAHRVPPLDNEPLPRVQSHS